MSSCSKRIGVVIPVYNKFNFVERTIQSALNQKESFHRIIVVDDGSTDGSLDLIKKYEGSVEIITQKNGGVSNARNRGLDEIRNSVDYVLFLDADDELTSNYVFNISNCSFDSRLIATYRIRSSGELVYRGNRHFSKETLFESWSKGESPIWTGCTAVRVHGLKARFNESYSHGEDRQFFLNCLQSNDEITIIDEIGAIYHKSPGSLSSEYIKPSQDAFFHCLVENGKYFYRSIYILKRVKTALIGGRFINALVWITGFFRR
jgi:glycosyltransferase involved in cell wall biosynthesis